MTTYNPKSLKAEEFISHEEILETIRYAEENKHNIALIDSLLEKVTETGNRIWNKYVEWQPYAYVTERGGNSYD